MQIKGFFTIFFLSFVLGGGLLAMEQQEGELLNEELLNLVNSHPNGADLFDFFCENLSNEVSKTALLATLLDDVNNEDLLKDEEMVEFYEKLRLGNLEDTDASARVRFVNKLFDTHPGLKTKYLLRCFEIYELCKPTKDTSSK